MKLTKTIWMAAACAVLAACQPAADETAATAAANKALVQRFYEDVFVDWDRELVAELLSPGFRSHDWPTDARTGPDGFWDFYDGVLASFPDTRKAATWMTTETVSMTKIPPTSTRRTSCLAMIATVPSAAPRAREPISPIKIDAG